MIVRLLNGDAYVVWPNTFINVTTDTFTFVAKQYWQRGAFNVVVEEIPAERAGLLVIPIHTVKQIEQR